MSKKKTIDTHCHTCKADRCHADFDGVQIIYYLPARELMNRRKTGHWTNTDKHIAEHRFVGQKWAEEAACDHRPLWTDAIIDATFFFEDKRSFQDPSNLLFWIKAYVDGIEDAGIVINDRVLQTGKMSQKVGVERFRKLNSPFGVVVIIRNNTKPQIPEPTPGRHDKFHKTIDKLEAKNKLKRKAKEKVSE